MRGEYANGKGNDLECLPSVNNVANGNKSTYNLRNWREKNTDTTTRDELKEMVDEFCRNQKEYWEKVECERGMGKGRLYS